MDTPIVPDTKDWTWVIGKQCTECGFDASAIAAGDVAELIRTNASAWEGLLAQGGNLTVRPRPGTWSPLEYACHVRDVYRLYDYRLGLMLTEDDPTYPNWDQDETAVKDRYNEQDPSAVAPDLVAAARVLADHFDHVACGQWQRTGTRSDGARFTVDTFARYLVHDPIHHLHDVSAGQGPAAHPRGGWPPPW